MKTKRPVPTRKAQRPVVRDMPAKKTVHGGAGKTEPPDPATPPGVPIPYPNAG